MISCAWGIGIRCYRVNSYLFFVSLSFLLTFFLLMFDIIIGYLSYKISCIPFQLLAHTRSFSWTGQLPSILTVITFLCFSAFLQRERSCSECCVFVLLSCRLLCGDRLIKKLFPDVVTDSPTEEQTEEMR